MKSFEPLVRDLRGHLLRRLDDVRCRSPVAGELLDLAPKRSFHDKRMHVFFGYYDSTPFSPDDTRILAMRLPERAIPGCDPVELGYYDLNREDGRFSPLGESATWCWQQGCRFQWYPGGSQESILYNVQVAGGYGSVIADGRSGAVQRLYGMPVYALDSAGRFGYSVNFSRLQRLRPGYGYGNVPDPFLDHPAPAGDGLWKLDFDSGESELVVSLSRLAEFHPHPDMGGATHYLNHVMCNPDGKRVLFMHLWVGVNGLRSNRLLTCNPDGSDLCLLVDSGRVSHFWWQNNTEVLAYAWEPGDDCYAYRVYSDFVATHRIDNLSLLQQDSHPSLSPDGHWLITDSYPDICRRQWLMLQQRGNEQFSILGSFFSPAKYTGEQRCDLHPRWNRQGTSLAIDATFTGRRGLHVFDVSDLVRRV
jgi:hypothetical protein